jgi:hypothetical protein
MRRFNLPTRLADEPPTPLTAALRALRAEHGADESVRRLADRLSRQLAPSVCAQPEPARSAWLFGLSLFVTVSVLGLYLSTGGSSHPVHHAAPRRTEPSAGAFPSAVASGVSADPRCLANEVPVAVLHSVMRRPLGR